MTHLYPFHLAFPVHDLKAAEDFYHGVLGCAIGRRAARWIDFNVFGHQLTAHLVDGLGDAAAVNAVDGDHVPTRHFGPILPWDLWQDLAHRIEEAGISFLIKPRIRFRGKAGEQGTFFIKDPSDNVLEFKSFRDMDRLYASDIEGDVP